MDWSYVAGFFDGEGNIWLAPNGYGKRTRPLLSITFYNNNLPALKAIQDFIGAGNLYLHQYAKKPNWNDSYHLKINSHKDALKVARSMLPYTIVKKDKLTQLIQFIESKNWRPFTPPKAIKGHIL